VLQTVRPRTNASFSSELAVSITSTPRVRRSCTQTQPFTSLATAPRARPCAPGGRVASTLGLSPDSVASADAQIIPVMAAPTSETLDRLAAAVLDGTLVVPIERTYVLADVPQAFADFAGGTLGKLAVIVD
jgi:hypothetical protein